MIPETLRGTAHTNSRLKIPFLSYYCLVEIQYCSQKLLFYYLKENEINLTQFPLFLSVSSLDVCDGRPVLKAYMDRVKAATNPHYDDAHKVVNKLKAKLWIKGSFVMACRSAEY